MHPTLDQLLADFDGTDRPGACLLVRKADSAVYRRCVGMADLEAGIPTSPESNFRLASLTKAFTATAVLTLVERGQLELGTTLATLLPGFPPWADRITVGQLLSHTSGLIDYETVMAAGDTAQIHDAEVVELLRRQDSTAFAPGSQFRYSNSGYAVLARIVERLSGRSFTDFLAAEVFDPLGMTGTVAHVEGTTEIPHRAYGYSRDSAGGWVRTDQSPTSAVLGDGGVYSSIDDLARWAAVLERRRSILTEDLQELAFQEVRLADGSGTGYGLGWFLDALEGHDRVYHTGTTIGFRNVIEWFPASDLTLVFLSNRDEGGITRVDEIVREALRIWR
ncbi:MAG: serine hydrolase domain-containing protein [Gemmatimonadales bacterium]